MVVINTFTVPVDGVVVEQDETRAYLNEKEIGKGTLYITESVLSWCDGSKRLGFSLQYPNIALHAARHDPFPALYIMVDHTLQLPESLMPLSEQGNAAVLHENSEENLEENSEDDEEGELGEGQSYSELLFCPPQDGAVQRMFLAMNQCQMLHPDPEDDDHDSDIYEDASEIMDDDNFVPVQPMDDTEEGMQGLHLGNGQIDEESVNGLNAEYDPAQFADD